LPPARSRSVVDDLLERDLFYPGAGRTEDQRMLCLSVPSMPLKGARLATGAGLALCAAALLLPSSALGATRTARAAESQARISQVSTPNAKPASPAAGAYCNEFVNAAITENSDRSISFGSSNQCVGIAPAQTIDVTLDGPTQNELDYADNSCGGCQVLGANGTWPGPAVPGDQYTMEITTVLTLPPSEEWAPPPAPGCVIVTPQTLRCQASASITAD
jgi:hypothetical protein